MWDMLPELNPFAPGSGLPPPSLTGRSAEIDAFDLVVARSRVRRASRGMILHGLRGVGKTVLLNEFRAQAEKANWFIVEIEGRPTQSGQAAVRHRLARSLLTAASRASRSTKLSEGLRRALGTVKSFSVSVGVVAVEIGVESAHGRADSGQIEIDFEELVEDLAPALLESSSAFAIFIDEMQELDDELLVALLAAQHRAGQKGWPFYIFGAGLPDLPSRLSSARSYAERLFDYRRIGPLEPTAAREALVSPIEKHGATFDPDALSSLLECAEGYPYFLQTYGRAVWDAARDRHITPEDAEAAITVGDDELDMGFYPSRWDKITDSEREYMITMAELGGETVGTGDIANALGRSATSKSKVRQSLIDKGLVYPPERGRLSFTVPRMASYIRRQYSN